MLPKNQWRPNNICPVDVHCIVSCNWAVEQETTPGCCLLSGSVSSVSWILINPGRLCWGRIPASAKVKRVSTGGESESLLRLTGAKWMHINESGLQLMIHLLPVQKLLLPITHSWFLSSAPSSEFFWGLQWERKKMMCTKLEQSLLRLTKHHSLVTR